MLRRRSPALGELSDDELLVRTKRSAEVFGEFFDRHHRELLTYFVSQTHSVDAAEDLAVETLAAALEGAHRFDAGLGNARQWLYGIARNNLRQYWRHLRVSRNATVRLGIVSDGAASDASRALEQAEESADRGPLFSALHRLPADQREAVFLRVVQEMAYADIARALECGEGAARMRVQRGLATLRIEFGVAG